MFGGTNRQLLCAVTARDLGSSSHTVAELIGGCLLYAAAASAGSWICVASVSAAAFLLLCAATAGAFGTVVVVHFPFELADGGFTRMSVFVTLMMSAGVFTLVDFYRWAAASV